MKGGSLKKFRTFFYTKVNDQLYKTGDSQCADAYPGCQDNIIASAFIQFDFGYKSIKTCHHHQIKKYIIADKYDQQ